MKKLRLRIGCEQTCSDDCELVSGIFYDKTGSDERKENAIWFLRHSFEAYRMIHCPLDFSRGAEDPLIISEPQHTVLRPDFYVLPANSEVPAWIVEFSEDPDDEITFLAKAAIYRNIGVPEYWVVDLTYEVLMMYDLKNRGFVPVVIDIPRRIKVQSYPGLYVNFTGIMGL